MLSGILFCSNFIYAVLYGVLLILQYKFVELIYIYGGGVRRHKSIQIYSKRDGRFGRYLVVISGYSILLLAVSATFTIVLFVHPTVVSRLLPIRG